MEERGKIGVKNKTKRKNRDQIDDGIDLKLKCIVEDCDSNKTFRTVRSLASHIRVKHRKQYLPKQLEELLMKKDVLIESNNNNEEVKEVSEQKTNATSIDLSDVLSKIESINNKIPEDLCDKFPELCKLGDKVDKLSGDVDQLKGNQIKKLVLQVPKQSEPAKVDMSVTDSKLERLNNSIIDINTKINSLSDKKENPQTKKSINNDAIKEKQEEVVDEHKEDIASMVSDAVYSAVKSAKNGSEHHKEISVDEIVNCPQCKKKVLDKLIENSKGNDNLDPAVMHFMESMGFIKSEDKKEEINNASKETVNNDEISNTRNVSGNIGESTKSGVNGDEGIAKPETIRSEQRSESGQETIAAEAAGKGNGAESNAGKPEEIKTEGGNGSGSGAGTSTGTDGSKPSIKQATSKDELPAESATEPRRCRLLFRSRE